MEGLWGDSFSSHLSEWESPPFLTSKKRNFLSPPYLQFYYFQMQHAVKAQGMRTPWTLSPTPIFHLISSVDHAKGLISQHYSMLLGNYLDGYSSKAREKWESDLGQISGDQ